MSEIIPADEGMLFNLCWVTAELSVSENGFSYTVPLFVDVLYGD